MAKVIDGKAFADNLCAELANEVKQLQADHALTPCIAVVLVGEDPASQVYVRNKIKRCEQLGIESREHRLDDTTTQEELLQLISDLNNDASVNGILVQLPVPDQINDSAVINAIASSKDVDGFHIENAGALSIGENQLVPCTPLGCEMMLKDHLGDLSGLRAVVVGRSNIVGKPMANLLLQNNCTVTIAHSRTRDLDQVCREADILVAAVGRPLFVKGDWIKPGATVIDVGINRIEVDGKNKLVGDVDYSAAAEVAGAITPVPGGAGPMTIACLMHNTVRAAKQQNGLA
ncbi:MAG: bifunctional methylenetetrahydrofolate dehydrogenase/methenyltetrahydrofolate cyclohydrolase FolD [Pseudomonadales bacterium]